MWLAGHDAAWQAQSAPRRMQGERREFDYKNGGNLRICDGGEFVLRMGDFSHEKGGDFVLRMGGFGMRTGDFLMRMAGICLGENGGPCCLTDCPDFWYEGSFAPDQV
jgi:hypothetical protein